MATTKAPAAPKRPPRAPKAAKARKSLTEELSALLAKTFLPDLRQRAGQPAVEHALRHAWQAERDRKRTAADFDEWAAATVEQVGAAWILSCVFVRVLEDRDLVQRRRIAGEGADDSLQQFLEIAPSLTERDYLLTVFRELATYPGAADVLDPAHNPAWRLSPSNDSIRALLALLREADADGRPRFRFGRDETPGTGFLGDLYQDLSESVRKHYALLQTPPFIERFILDQTLEPAIAEFGLDAVRLIDPTCGSGHFLLGAFHRLFEHRQRVAPGLDRRAHANAALAQVHGVDINPYAVAIARFRLTLAYLEHAGIDKLAQAPRIATNVVVADSLLHGAGQGRLSELADDKTAWGDDMFVLDDPPGARRIFGQRYHAVVGNPPYITCKDPALRELYREAYASAAGKYALSAPFTERFFQLAEPGGYVGMINANSFMKREFGKALITQVLPRYDLTEVVDTAGAYIPGHGTPTVLLFGRNRPGVADGVHAVMGKRGEPTTPDDAEQGHVWSSIAAHHMEVGFENDYISVAEMERATLNKHPWSLGGGGAAELKELLEERCEKRLGDIADSIGISSFTLEDDVYLAPRDALIRSGVEDQFIRPMVTGEVIRDWTIGETPWALFPYDAELRPNVSPDAAALKFLWPYRTSLAGNLLFGGKTKVQGGLKWFEYGRLTAEKLRTPLSITFAEVATHNHFVLDRGGKVFKQTAPIIKLPPTATEDDHLALLAYLNSSTACFWMKQVFYPKATHSEARPEKGVPEDNRFAFAGTGMKNMPVPDLNRPLIELAREIELLSSQRLEYEPASALRRAAASDDDLREAVVMAERKNEDLLTRMIAVQEDLDWAVYALVGMSDPANAARWSEGVRLQKNSRPFAFEKPPSSLQANDRALWLARRSALLASPELALIETAVNKRRWWGARGVFASKVATYQERAVAAARDLLAEWAEEACRSQAHPVRAKDLASQAPERIRRLAHLTGAEDVTAALIEALAPQSVPYLAPLTYSVEGLDKCAAWERTWELQRAEDRNGANGAIPVPPKYEPDDYLQFSYWSNRGKLNVSKERFISYPGCERDEDKSPLIGWAGWNHLQRAQALAALFQERKDQDGWPAARLVPILAGLLELLPWLKQWHNEPDPAYDGQRMGDVYESFVSEKARELQVTLDDLRTWRPEKKTKAAKAAAKKEVTT